MTDDNDKAKAFFILHDKDVVDKKVVDVLSKLFNDSIDRTASRRNAQHFLDTLMIADAKDNHPIMTQVMNELFHSGRLRMSNPGAGDFIDSIRALIRMAVEEEMHRALNQIERRVEDLKRAEFNNRYNRFLR